MMKISEIVPYLKKKNIKFEKINEHEAEEYLRKNVKEILQPLIKQMIEEKPIKPVKNNNIIFSFIV